ncbi:MAG: F0F1 ATP synthase subunit B [Flammeovirgaceae bacterium]|nr:F0F1 ATP synthase subunit B [Flammeovirgaceae bacterium]
MDLLTPGSGLIIWQLFIFVLLVLLLGKLAWKPILASLKEREESIQQALDSAESAKKEMASLKADNEILLRETREERDKILRDARTAANRIHDEAQVDAKKNADRMIEDAKSIIQTERNAALRDVKEQVAMFSIEIAEKLIKKNLSDDKTQKELANTFIKDLKLN